MPCSVRQFAEHLFKSPIVAGTLPWIPPSVCLMALVSSIEGDYLLDSGYKDSRTCGTQSPLVNFLGTARRGNRCDHVYCY